MTNGTETEIQAQAVVVYNLKNQLMAAELRLRALRGDALMQNGDSWDSAAFGVVLDELGREFGTRNIRMI